MKKRKRQMPGFYGRNIARDAQRKFLQRKAMEADREKRRDIPAESADGGKKE